MNGRYSMASVSSSVLYVRQCRACVIFASTCKIETRVVDGIYSIVYSIIVRNEPSGLERRDLIELINVTGGFLSKPFWCLLYILCLTMHNKVVINHN